MKKKFLPSRRLKTLLVCVFLIVVLILRTNKKQEDNVTILFWTKYYEANPLNKLPPGDFSSDKSHKVIKCPLVNHCKFTTNQSELNESDGIVFHARDLVDWSLDSKKPQDLPTVRDLSKPWIFLHEESPIYTVLWLPLYSNVFNWTMTYRSDSDIHFPYGKVLLSHSSSSLPQKEQNLPNRTGKVAWTVSHCKTNSEREKVVAELSKFIDVHIYGTCGSHTCNFDEDGCLKQLESNYKFYLAFENSLCHEYVTEKFFNALSHSIVPVVYGFGPYETIAPTGSYINVRDFQSIKALGAYLVFLDNNPEEYNKFFEWKKQYTVQVPYLDPWCELCQKLMVHKDGGSHTTKWYSDLGHWYKTKVSQPVKSNTNSGQWNNKPEKACVGPKQFNILKK